MTLFLALLDLEDWRATVERSSVEKAFVQDYQTSEIVHDIYRRVTSSIVLTARAHRGELIYVARIVVERTDIWDNDKGAARRLALASNAEQALGLVSAYILDRVTWLHIQPGLLLIPGMLADLPRIHTSHNLWRWEKTGDDTRRLVPTEADDDAPPADVP